MEFWPKLYQLLLGQMKSRVIKEYGAECGLVGPDVQACPVHILWNQVRVACH